jgi:hypothetical protein
MESWEDLQSLYRDHKDEIAQHGAVVIDTVGRCLDMLSVDIIRESPKMGQSDGSLALKGWGALKTKWGAFERATRALGVDLVLIAHDRETGDGDARVVRPDVQGGSYGEVIKTADAIGYCYMEGRRRTLDFSPSDRWIGKNPAAWPPFQVPAFAAEPLFLRGTLDRLKEHLNDRSRANADATKAAESWWERLGAINHVGQLNALLPEVNALKNPLRAQVASMVNSHAKASGWTFDKKVKTFSAPEPAEEEEAFA